VDRSKNPIVEISKGFQTQGHVRAADTRPRRCSFEYPRFRHQDGVNTNVEKIAALTRVPRRRANDILNVRSLGCDFGSDKLNTLGPGCGKHSSLSPAITTTHIPMIPGAKLVLLRQFQHHASSARRPRPALSIGRVRGKLTFEVPAPVSHEPRACAQNSSAAAVIGCDEAGFEY
jgi:hypothetical protein